MPPSGRVPRQVVWKKFMKVLLIQLDGKLPNIALMRIAAHHADDEKTLVHGGERGLWDQEWDRVYASAIFEKTRPAVERVRREYPAAVIGGTGVDLSITLEQHGIITTRQDYSIYPSFRPSIGFTQRGCRLKCEFELVRKRLQHLLAQIGAEDRCSSSICGKRILWVRHRNGSATPYDSDGTPHFATCIARNQFRKK